MTRLVEITDYNPNWPEEFLIEANLLQDALGGNCIEIHHVGSTAVPGLSSKPVIDIIAVVKIRNNAIPSLISAEYECRGEINIPFQLYCRKGTKINLHVYELGNSEIKLNLLFRDYLRANPPVKAAYASLKKELVSKESSHKKQNSIFTEYNLGKDQFIRGVLQTIQFDEIRIAFCTHYHEWDEYHRIRQEQIFSPNGIAYNKNHASLTSKDFFHFVLYKGTKIVTVAMVEFPKEGYAILRILATDEGQKNKGYGANMMMLLEKWIKQQGYGAVKMHASPNAEKFYRRLGYIDVEFDDISINPDSINLGKLL